MDEPLDNSWSEFCDSIQALQRSISRSTAVKVNAANLRENARQVVRVHFRASRPDLQILGVDGQLIGILDRLMRRLLILSMRPNAKKSYMSLFNDLSDSIEKVTIGREYRFAEEAVESASPETNIMSEFETGIYESLADLVPSAARSYKQAIIDLADDTRYSYRGAANELREALREALDHLAPDKVVEDQPNFKYAKDQTKPTRKQKARFILRARGQSRTAMKVPEDALEAVEEKVSIVVSAAYGRANVSTHVETERIEVIQVKRYVDAVLAELLALPPS
jgi:hypothetical protein